MVDTTTSQNILAELMEKSGYGHILKKYTEPQDIQEWYEGELQRHHEQLREHLGTPKEDFYRTELQNFRSKFHKPVIYATWNWEDTVLDALHQAGFASAVASLGTAFTELQET